MPSIPESTARILDANLNRAREAARVIEEFFRFVLNDPHSAEDAKNLRHGIVKAAKDLESEALLSARDNHADVGCQITNQSESQRADMRAVVDASFARLSEALRTLEEYGKTISVGFAKQTEGLRYQSYQLESALPYRLHLKNLSEARVMPILGGQGELKPVEMVKQLVDAGQKLFQIREKAGNDASLMKAIAPWMDAFAHHDGLTVLINDRVDMALHFGASGVHLGQDDMPIEQAKKLLGPTRIATLSTHNSDEIHAGSAADGFGAGAIFPTKTKDVSHLGGIAWGAEATRATEKPVFCIGGITLDSVAEVAAAGIKRVALSSAIMRSKTPHKVLATIKDALSG